MPPLAPVGGRGLRESQKQDSFPTEREVAYTGTGDTFPIRLDHQNCRDPKKGKEAAPNPLSESPKLYKLQQHWQSEKKKMIDLSELRSQAPSRDRAALNAVGNF